ncbi:hypothetical protein [Sporosarcina sp. FSL K6-2383]|uniref:hypothetical protein n=1 Tax=Sporosarcina sp. FSL K6-2383 TaxID=2921556 RepID=UPI00315A001B
MISENTRQNSFQQLEQTIIYLKAELAKYKNEVRKVQSDYYYSLSEKLTDDNEQLTVEKNELTEDLFRLNRELVKRTSEYKERIHSYEIQSKKQLETIDALQQMKSVSIMIEQLEYRLMSHIQNANKPLLPTIDQLAQSNKEHSEFDQVEQHLLQEIDEKNNIIDKLRLEFSVIQEQNDKLVAGNGASAIDTETFMQVDLQIKKLLGQSLEYEEQLSAKLLALHTLEHKLDQLTVEVDEIKIFGVSGQISKVE